jgi:ribosomal protein L16 Arg81 hydroxylase
MQAGDLIYIPASVSLCGVDENGIPAHRSICTEKPAVVLVVGRSKENWLTVAMDGRLWGLRPDQGMLYQKGVKSK